MAISQLSSAHFSGDHDRLLEGLSQGRRIGSTGAGAVRSRLSRPLLLIQDLDGVCMPLVRDPLQRRVDPAYLRACKAMQGSFAVLTNGEHGGRRGMNPIVEAAVGDAEAVRREGLYLPGLAGGGVQIQDCHGRIEHPGVSAAELTFLEQVPIRLRDALTSLLAGPSFGLQGAELEALVQTAVLDNQVSPTLNINTLFPYFGAEPELWGRLQQAMAALMEGLLDQAAAEGLAGSFFVHLAPNLGSSGDRERLRPGQAGDAGTTDFQFMLSGAVKEAGVLVLLNQHVHSRTGHYPLGPDFTVRTAPRGHTDLLRLAQECFDPATLPQLVGVGDTLTSQPAGPGSGERLRGGSDRGFLRLVQDLGRQFSTDNLVLFVDSSRGEVRRPGLGDGLQEGTPGAEPPWEAVEGISDPADPLRLQYLFAGGHRQYTAWFAGLAAALNPGNGAIPSDADAPATPPT
ncbi:glucosylglycerol 3-phosphatase [Synechococcus sp. CCY9201]|uniref:glucosylglycerol 3-phosphatase n=1 Tax=Synechococcus sp. CCY9201 TaxID=174697 RepID=UPI002B217216|nr:glucosylglycerol 3-phosphatase [Synechococcus sp. CCY9201]MEA5475898.1 glucosylglycerol 3-phosphatase [Synechococcus sp. CCY9201]